MNKELRAKLLNKSNKIASAVEAEIEDVLEDSENAIKSVASAKSVNVALKKVEDKLLTEGVKAQFAKDKSKTEIDAALSKEDIDSIVEKVVPAICDEIEDLLKDADEVADQYVNEESDSDSDSDEETLYEIENSIKSNVEKKLASVGVNFNLVRNHKAPEKKVEKTSKVKSNKIASRITSEKKEKKDFLDVFKSLRNKRSK